MVPGPARRAHAAAARRLAGDPGRAEHAHRGPDRLGQDARGVPLGDRFADPPGAGARRRDARPLHLAAARSLERRPEEPPGAARRDPRPRPVGPGGTRPRAYGRHALGRAHRDDPPAAPHPRDDAGVALSPPDERGRPEDAAHGLDGHRRRDPRAHPRQARQPSRAFARAPRAPRGPAHSAGGPLGHAEAARRGRPLPRRRRARLHARRRRHVPGARPRDRGPAVAARGRLLARAVAGDLRADRRTRPRAPDDARLREHAQDGRTHLGAAHAPPRRGRRDEPPRQPLESAAPRRRAAPEGRQAARARRDGVAGARDRRRRRGSRDPGRRDALDRDVPPARRPRGTRAPEGPEGAALPSHARRARRRGGPSRVDPPFRPRPDADAAAAAGHPRAADRRGLRRRSLGGARALRPREEGLALPGAFARGVRPRRRSPHGRAAGATAPRRRERPPHGHAALAADGAHVRRRDSRHGRLPGPAGAGGNGRRDRQRGLGRRVERRRHLPARQRVVARPAHRARHRPRRGREGPAADASLLARGGARPDAGARGGDRNSQRGCVRGGGGVPFDAASTV